MKNKTGLSSIWAMPAKIDWKLLIFLLLFLNVKLVVKIAAVILIYILRPDFKFGFGVKKSRLPLFYLLVVAIAIFNWLISGLVGNFNYDLILVTGILFWASCILAIHQIKCAVEKNDSETIHNTIVAFFIINALLSLAVYAGIVWETGAINPYRYQGNYQKYFIGTGDYIKGVTLDTSTTNAVLNAFGVIYFLLRSRDVLTLLCMTVLLLTGSNISNLLLLGTLVFIFFFQAGRNQKSIIIICLMMLITFLVKVSPQNNEYVTSAYQRLFNIPPASRETKIPLVQKPDSILTTEERKIKFARAYVDSVNISLFEENKRKSAGTLASMSIAGFIAKPVIPKDSIHTTKFQHRSDTTAVEQKLIEFVKKHNEDMPIAAGRMDRPRVPGKLIALQQTIRFFQEHPVKILTGTGIGNFSSKLAFRATSMKVTGSYPEKYAYISKEFESNHFDLYLYYFTNKDDLHSIVNSPNSTYDQLLGEYGLAGLFSFVVFYMGFFLKQINILSYAAPLILFMLGAFFIEYWFEQLSVVILFELLVLLNLKETNLTGVNENN